MSDHEQDLAPAVDDRPGGTRLGPTSFVLIGLAVGLVLAIVLLWVWRGNPFSAANEVRYSDVVVGSVTGDADQICWSAEPDRRDAPQTCAILALDPEIEVPEQGDLVTIGLVELRTPDGTELTQVVHVAPVEGGEIEVEMGDDTETPAPTE
jgi:hypothetical protein